jgi:hypothetical protein
MQVGYLQEDLVVGMLVLEEKEVLVLLMMVLVWLVMLDLEWFVVVAIELLFEKLVLVLLVLLSVLPVVEEEMLEFVLLHWQQSHSQSAQASASNCKLLLRHGVHIVQTADSNGNQVVANCSQK